MKRFALISLLIIAAVCGLIYADTRTENDLIEELGIILTPDPMEINTYDQGECTYYVFNKVKDDGMMIERSWGDAEHWADRAEREDYTVNETPAKGALMQTERGEIGHVAYIESVNNDGSFEISEMNFRKPYEITERTILAEEIADYNYIHPKVNKHANPE